MVLYYKTMYRITYHRPEGTKEKEKGNMNLLMLLLGVNLDYGARDITGKGVKVIFFFSFLKWRWTILGSFGTFSHFLLSPLTFFFYIVKN